MFPIPEGSTHIPGPLQPVGLNSKTPTLSTFSGEETPSKHKITFKHWLFEVQTIQQGTYHLFSQVSCNHLVRCLDHDPSLHRILEKLETVYSTVASSICSYRIFIG